MIDRRKTSPDWVAKKRDIGWDAHIDSASKNHRQTGIGPGGDRVFADEASRVSTLLPHRGKYTATPLPICDEKKRRLGDHATTGHPGELRNFDLAETEERLLHVVYADDDWVDTNWGGNEEHGHVNLSSSKHEQVEKRCGDGAPTTISHMSHPYRGNFILRPGEAEQMGGSRPNRFEENRDRRNQQATRRGAKGTNRVEWAS